jgi:hypothetical protein
MTVGYDRMATYGKTCFPYPLNAIIIIIIIYIIQ